MTVSRRTMIFSVAVAALGYFVDLYDIVIFGVVRVASLQDLGISGDAVTRWGIHLFNLQMIGLLIGGVVWGVIGDRMGRRFALLSTITLYSLANLANAFVTDVWQYAILRFVAGVGLAGELGAGVTLVAELLPKNRRGYGTTIISFLGLVGALTASYVGGELPWRWAYAIGGLMGLLVLAGRYVGLRESELFTQSSARPAGRGDLRLLVSSGATFGKFIAVIAIGVPIWYVSALFVNFAPEFGRALAMAEPLTVADVLRYQAIGLAIGSAVSGVASEWIGSRKRVVYASLAVMAVLTLLLTQRGSVERFHWLMLVMGLAQGYWTAFITMAAEQFGTNIRATVATSVPNFVRAMTVPVTLAVAALAPSFGWIPAVLALGVAIYGLALVALVTLEETYGKDLNYLER